MEMLGIRFGRISDHVIEKVGVPPRKRCFLREL